MKIKNWWRSVSPLRKFIMISQTIVFYYSRLKKMTMFSKLLFDTNVEICWKNFKIYLWPYLSSCLPQSLWILTVLFRKLQFLAKKLPPSMWLKDRLCQFICRLLMSMTNILNTLYLVRKVGLKIVGLPFSPCFRALCSVGW